MDKTFFETLAALPASVFSNDKVLFRLIRNQADLSYAIFDCELTPEQAVLVNPAGFSIGRAYLKPQDNYPCVICTTDSEPIGFIVLLRWLGKGDHLSWSFYVDRRSQNKGYGRAAAELAVRILKTAYPEKTIKLSTEENNRKAQALYRSLGFQKLDELDGDDLVFGL